MHTHLSHLTNEEFLRHALVEIDTFKASAVEIELLQRFTAANDRLHRLKPEINSLARITQ